MPENFNESQMWAEATSWTEGLNKAGMADIFFKYWPDGASIVFFSDLVNVIERQQYPALVME